MCIINPCDCGGLPYISPYQIDDNELYLVRCMLCGNVGKIEYTQTEAVEKWNEMNYSYSLK